MQYFVIASLKYITHIVWSEKMLLIWLHQMTKYLHTKIFAMKVYPNIEWKFVSELNYDFFFYQTV